MTVKNEMAQFMRGIVAAVFRRFVGIEEDHWRLAPPNRKGVHLAGVNGQSENTDPFGFKKMDHIFDRQGSNSPMLPQSFASCFRCRFVTKIWNVELRKVEPFFDKPAQVIGN